MESTNPGTGPVMIGVPCERVRGERRVALVPETIVQLVALGFGVVVQSGAGKGAEIDDESYSLAGAAIEPSAAAVYERAEIVAKVQPPLLEEIELMKPGTVLLSFLQRDRDADVVERLEERGVVAFSFNSVPRTTRAQMMDALSAMSTIAGYKAVLLAADSIGRFFPMLMTAAGTVSPSRVFVIGAGVAGLQALATARRLGAITSACDARPAAQEQVKSVGAKFIDMSVEAEGAGGYARALGEELLAQERDVIRDHIANADVVICTAMVPGARAPILIDEAAVGAMRSGSVIVDLAAEAGGNCALTVPGEVVCRHGVTILAPLNIVSGVAIHASFMYAKTVAAAIRLFVKDGALYLDLEDDIVRAACLTGVPRAVEQT